MAEPTPRVSVVLVDAHDGDALRAAVRAVLGQTEPDSELLIVDDGVLDVVDELAVLDDPRLVLVAAPGVTRLARLNLGIALARGRFLLILSPSTSSLEPGDLRRRADALDERPDCDVALLLAAAVGSADGTASDATPRHCSSAALLLDVLAGLVPAPAAALIRTGALRAIGGFDATLTLAHDDDLWLRLLPERRIAVLRAPHAPVLAAPSVIPHPAPERAGSRSERAYVTVRAVRDRGIDWWRHTVGDARGDGDARAAWVELCVRLLRTRLPEVAPLLREARRRASAEGIVLPAEAELRLRAGEPAASFAALEPAGETAHGPARARAAEAATELSGAAAVHDLARLATRTERTVRDLRARAAALEAATSALGSDLAHARTASAAAIELGTRAFEKLRLARRLKAFSRHVAARARLALVKQKPPAGE